MSKARFAGTVFNGTRKLLGQGSRLLGIDKMGAIEKAARFGPDALFATMNAVQTPGDLADKVIAGTTDFIGSAGTGLVVAAPFKKAPVVAGMIDQAGSIAGMYGGMAVSENMQRAKDRAMGGQGLSAYERAGVEYDEALKQQLLAELDAAGLLNITNDNTGVIYG